MLRITPELLLRAYALGVFPMAESRHDKELYWIDPKQRGVLPLDRFHVPHSVRKTARRHKFEIRVDTAFSEVIEGCAESGPRRPDSWINDEILRLYTALHEAGHAHSVEAWRNNQLAGGLYGVVIGAAFFGESMFSRETDASKIALLHLVARLRCAGFELLDTQFVTKHLARFGGIEIPRQRYQELLQRAISHKADFYCEVPDSALEELMQSSTQIS
jgi:leucyl/phenylalanyl-tRNA---protein transferase